MFEIVGLGEPVRLIVSGVHGSEGIVTAPILKSVSKRVKDGSVILCNLSKGGKYASTLSPVYYQTRIGRRLLSLIRGYKPEIYIELHSYERKNYSKLTDPSRRKRMGVPPMIYLEDGILLGSVSPHIRTSEFGKYDLCLTLDVPVDLGDTHVVTRILNMVIASSNKFEFLEKLRKRYPMQVKIAEKYFYEYFKDIEPF
jgi:hypothetical protein